MDYNIGSAQISTGLLIGSAAIFAGIAAVGALTASQQYDTWNFAQSVYSTTPSALHGQFAN